MSSDHWDDHDVVRMAQRVRDVELALLRSGAVRDQMRIAELEEFAKKVKENGDAVIEAPNAKAWELRDKLMWLRLQARRLLGMEVEP